uniref:glycosyltransferase WbsX family protein n=1 Tax=Pedobacter schmidteae TaxID=2201271 RepID=UPI000EB2BBFD|nr:glycoside hydrolase family 99-like domain-containing protein [Pedobacter schmidteae]
MEQIKPIAIHLPQFHPFAENDEWWGKGFTEWTNVTKAKPLFKGHQQPHLPADLGFYDLRLSAARMAQMELAKAYGIYGFCYYHYWFNGKRLMQEPIDLMLKNPKEDFPFMLCWANENWTRRWDGMDKEVLIHQDYSQEDDIAHIHFLCRFFSDSRYIRVDGKPFFVIYRPALFPDIKQTLATWRSEAIRMGIGQLHIGFMNSFSFNEAPETYGFDCKIDFQPNFSALPRQEFAPLREKIQTKLGIKKSAYYGNRILSYDKYVDKTINELKTIPKTYPGITPGWDNSARRASGSTIFKDATPQAYGRWLKHICKTYKNQDTFLFINAWNEWAEGNHLEPCQKWSRQYLEITKDVLSNG